MSSILFYYLDKKVILIQAKNIPFKLGDCYRIRALLKSSPLITTIAADVSER